MVKTVTWASLVSLQLPPYLGIVTMVHSRRLGGLPQRSPARYTCTISSPQSSRRQLTTLVTYKPKNQPRNQELACPSANGHGIPCGLQLGSAGET